MASYDERSQTVPQQLDRAEKDLVGLKNVQFYGSQSLQTKESRSSKLTSEQLIIFGTYVNEYLYKDILFTADSQLNPFGRLSMEVYTPDATTPATNASGIDVFEFQFITTPIDSKTLKFRVDIRGPINIKFYCVFKVLASDTGTVVVSAVTP